MKNWILVLLAIAVTGAAWAETRPNVIFILTDDLGYSDISCYGATRVKTPNLDRMAAKGLRITDFHTAAPICSPSRAAFLTGAYPHRCGLYMGINQNREAHWFLGLNPDEITIAEQFKNQGYTTAMIGKWHLGKEEKFSYFHQGFDRYYGAPDNMGHNAAESEDVAGGNPERVKEMMALAEKTRLKLGEFMERGSEQRPTGTLFPEVPILSNQNQDWVKLSDAEKDRGKTQFRPTRTAGKNPKHRNPNRTQK
jgi:arylsulfatase A-like enzyme